MRDFLRKVRAAPIWARMPRWSLDALACAVIVAVGYVYMLPLSRDIFRPNTSRMIGDGTDLTSLSWGYRIIMDAWLHEPSRLLFGSIFTENTNAPMGSVLWTPWIERILVPLLWPFTDDANVVTAMAWALMALTGVSTYVYGRLLKWPRLVSLAMGICFAYNSFTRARANVHTAFCGLFGIVAIFIALELLSNREWMKPERVKRSLVWASVALFVATLSPHYYLVIFITLVPFFAVYFLLRARSARLPLLPSMGRLLLCSLPAVLFLAWNFAMPVAPKYAGRIQAIPEIRKEHLEYLHAFGAHPIDYLGFDLKLGDKDWIDARQAITKTIRREIGGSNDHERSNGVRWSLLALFAAAVVAQLWPNHPRGLEARSSQRRKLFIAFAVICFLLSMSPQGLKSYDEELGPSLYVFKMLPNFRVPSRFGPFAMFGIIVVAAEFLVSVTRRWRSTRKLATWVLNPLLPVVAFVDYAPLNPMQVASFSYARTELSLPSGECGMGMGLPFSHWGYWIFMQTRGTQCQVMFPADAATERTLERYFVDTGGPEQEKLRADFTRFARCTGMDWVIFTSYVQQPARERICADLGWTFVSNDSCRSPTVNPRKRPALECLSR